MKRPIRIVLPPWRSKYPSTCSRRSWVILTSGPCVSRNLRPSRRPMKKLAVSPSTAQIHTRPIRGKMSISPWPAITPPAITTVSPGATSPTNAPVSRKAIDADERVRPGAERLRDVLDQLLGVGQGRQHPAGVDRQRERPARARPDLRSSSSRRQRRKRRRRRAGRPGRPPRCGSRTRPGLQGEVSGCRSLVAARRTRRRRSAAPRPAGRARSRWGPSRSPRGERPGRAQGVERAVKVRAAARSRPAGGRSRLAAASASTARAARRRRGSGSSRSRHAMRGDRPRRRPRPVRRPSRAAGPAPRPAPGARTAPPARPLPVTSAWRGSTWLGHVRARARTPSSRSSPAVERPAGDLVGGAQGGGGVGAAAAEPAATGIRFSISTSSGGSSRSSARGTRAARVRPGSRRSRPAHDDRGPRRRRLARKRRARRPARARRRASRAACRPSARARPDLEYRG